MLLLPYTKNGHFAGKLVCWPHWNPIIVPATVPIRAKQAVVMRPSLPKYHEIGKSIKQPAIVNPAINVFESITSTPPTRAGVLLFSLVQIQVILVYIFPHLLKRVGPLARVNQSVPPGLLMLVRYLSLVGRLAFL